MAELEIFMTSKALHFTEGGVARILWPGSRYRLERGEALQFVLKNLGWIVESESESSEDGERNVPEPEPKSKPRGSDRSRKRARHARGTKKRTQD